MVAFGQTNVLEKENVRLKRLVAEHEKRLSSHLSESEQATLVRLLRKILPERR